MSGYIQTAAAAEDSRREMAATGRGAGSSFRPLGRGWRRKVGAGAAS